MDKNDVNNALDEIIRLKENMSRNMDGMKCPVCKIVQGKENFGFTKYYCKHMTEIVDTKVESQMCDADHESKDDKNVEGVE